MLNFRKSLIFGVSLSLTLLASSGAMAEVKMKPEHRRALLHGVTQNLTEEYLMNDQTTSGCWDAAKRGDDVSLFAIYIIAKATPIMVKYRDAMNKAVKHRGGVSDRHQIMLDAYHAINPEEAGWYLQRVPAAVIHCLEVSGGVDLSSEKEALTNDVRERLNLNE